MAQLRHRRLGRTGLEVTELGLGAMDTPGSPEGVETLRAALDAGIDFIDTAREYAGSEFLIGQEVRARASQAPGRPGFHIGTKSFSRTADGVQREIDRSLSMLGVECIDLYQLHDVTTPEAFAQVMGADGALEGLRIAQYRGLIDHIGVSTHDLDTARLLIDSGEFGTIMLEYSAFYPQSAPLLALAHERDIGVIVMRPLGGSGRTSVIRGRLAAGTAGLLTPASLLRYVLSNPAISVAIPGASYPSRVHENVATASSYEPLGWDELRALEAATIDFY
ncbi:MAG: aldo/keto reductase [Dehalococcoidia bacterium]|nr:aldo/keto reductase [Dehalococcoidia bacterium]